MFDKLNKPDPILAAAMPAIKKFLEPMITDAQSAVHKLLLGPQPETLRENLDKVFNAKGNLPQAEADKVWEAVRATLGGE